jgi:hypothetical protein
MEDSQTKSLSVASLPPSKLYLSRNMNEYPGAVTRPDIDFKLSMRVPPFNAVKKGVLSQRPPHCYVEPEDYQNILREKDNAATYHQEKFGNTALSWKLIHHPNRPLDANNVSWILDLKPDAKLQSEDQDAKKPFSMRFINYTINDWKKKDKKTDTKKKKPVTDSTVFVPGSKFYSQWNNIIGGPFKVENTHGKNNLTSFKWATTLRGQSSNRVNDSVSEWLGKKQKGLNIIEESDIKLNYLKNIVHILPTKKVPKKPKKSDKSPTTKEEEEDEEGNSQDGY